MASSTSTVPAASSANPEPVPMLDLKRQYASIKDDVAAAVERVLTTQYFIGGPELDAFERESAAYLRVRSSLGCASGTDALWLALEAAGVQPGDHVITSAFTFFASASSIARCGAIPVFADVDPATLNIDPESVEKLLAGPQPVRAVMPVHLYGQCADMDAFAALATQHGFAIIEDAAQAFGANWRGKKAGTLGRAGAFSFYPTKNLSAYGDGGAVSTDDEELAAHVRRLRNHGSRQRYYHEEVGWNSRLDALQAAVLRIKLQHIDDWNQLRREVAAKYDTLFGDAGLVKHGALSVDAQAPVGLLETRPEAFHIYHQYVVRAFRRDELRAFLTSHGIGTEIYYPVPLHLQQSFADLGYKPGELPVSEAAAKEALALPIFPELREDEVQRVVAAIAEFYSR
ncbi:MAG TPA: DegT/DnrJ/EryC1/StrS family aminotransferase [Terriglobales bacterium]|jgi:dTDP-4-amino-4,6-dideoxygalactose transaminase